MSQRRSLSHTPVWGDGAEEIEERKSNRPRRRRWLLAARLAVGVSLLGVGWWAFTHIREGAPAAPHSVLAAEFEQQGGLMLCWPENLSPAEAKVLVDIVAGARQQLQVIVVVPDLPVQQRAQEMMLQEGIALDAIEFITAPVEMPWVRDFGPLVLKSSSGQWEIVDPDYGQGAFEDHLPQLMGRVMALPATRMPILCEGGNLLTNGAGLCISSKAILERNASINGYGKKQVSNAIRDHLGVDQIVYLDYLVGEPSSHVDMFAAFVAPDAIVVGRYAPDEDPVNATILDRNARRLSGLRTAFGPLRVYRISMPPRVGDAWPTYTNVVFANGRLLVPIYAADYDPAGREQALQLYRRLLPGWDVTTVECGPLLHKGGGLRCATMNLHRLPPASLMSRSP